MCIRDSSYTLYRQQKRPPAIPFEGLEELFADTDDDPEQTLIRRCEQEQVHQALEQLHESYRDVLSMKYLYSMSDEEIASVLNIKPASVRVVVHRALKSLKKNYHLREEGEIK